MEEISPKGIMGSRVSTLNEWIQIDIGGNHDTSSKRPRHNQIRTSKYTLLTFLPKNLFEQFRRVANFYFLIIGIISLLIDSPVSPAAKLVPLALVVGVAAIKQALEDFKRYRSDKEVNSLPVTVIAKNGKQCQIESQYVGPGDLVVVERDCDVPCDLVLLRSSDPHGKCIITTANLDGESNLKTLMMPRDLPQVDMEQMHTLGVIECESPKTDLYSFNGKIELAGAEGRVLPLNTDNVLLRGSRIKNTESVIGCAIYTGMTTKLQLNMHMTSNKMSSSETFLNRFILFSLAVMTLVVLVFFYMKRYNELFVVPLHSYLGPASDTNSARSILQDLSSFIVLFNYLIPITLYITVDFNRFLGGFFLEWDKHLYDKDTDQPCVVNTSNLNEELGQINILFSDKTGTLTKNEMHFQQCSIDGSKFLYKDGRLEDETTGVEIQIKDLNENQWNFFQTLAICHTVQPSIKNNGDIPDYQNANPDEKALVEACAHLGLVFLGDDDEVMRLRVVAKMEELKFDRLHVIEFTSERKRMSVIVKDENGDRWIYTKGAESYVFPLCANSSSELVAKTDKHISDFAQLGLRTLAVGRRRIGEEEFQTFISELNVANSSLGNRKELSEQCYAKIERDLDLLGSTAVEDALQDDVVDTLSSLQKAGIKIWVLTGDKVETALNIAISCGHIPTDAAKYFIVDCTNKDDLLEHLYALDGQIKTKGRKCALLMDGNSLSIALSETPSEFRDVSIKCTAVLCCRLSPLQKKEIVSLIKTHTLGLTTAAIGDGANDISMIQEAHVGIGIMGKEGRQATICSDYAIAKFCLLKRLLLVHGQYYTTRMSQLILYFFYKNFLFMGCMFFFQFHTLFSTTSIYDSLFLALYNVIFTFMPIYIMSLTEKNIPEETLMRQPELYKTNTHNSQLSWSNFLSWVSFGSYHAVVIFYLANTMFSLNSALLNGGQTTDFTGFSVLLFQFAIIVSILKLWLEAKYITYWFIFFVIGSIFVFMVLMYIYNILNWIFDVDYYWTYNYLLDSWSFWLLMIVTVVACFVPDYTIRIAFKAIRMPKRKFFPGQGLPMKRKITEDVEEKRS